MFSRRHPRMNRRGLGVTGDPDLPGVGSATLKWRMRADLGPTVKGTELSAWADQSVSGFNVVQATAANQPTWSGAAINGRQAVLFNVSALDFLSPTGNNSGANWIFGHDGTGLTLFAVVDTTAAALGSGGAVCADCTTATTDTGIALVCSATQAIFRQMDANAGGLNAQVAGSMAAGKHVISVVYSTALTPDITVFVDGVSVATGDLARAAPSGNATAGMAIGFCPGGALFWDKFIGEIIAFGGVLNAADRGAVEAYLRSYWRI